MNNTPKHLSILLTDDMAENRSFIYQILNFISNNAQFNEVANGKAAVDAVATKIKETGNSFDLIIMDFQMPIMNGADATTAIRRLEQPLPHKSIIITWSSAKSAPYKDADDWLPKRTTKEEVRALLKHYELI